MTLKFYRVPGQRKGKIHISVDNVKTLCGRSINPLDWEETERTEWHLCKICKNISRYVSVTNGLQTKLG